eukprot:1068032-Rhodomonas_salina.1
MLVARSVLNPSPMHGTQTKTQPVLIADMDAVFPSCWMAFWTPTAWAPPTRAAASGTGARLSCRPAPWTNRSSPTFGDGAGTASVEGQTGSSGSCSRGRHRPASFTRCARRQRRGVGTGDGSAFREW